MISFRHYFYLHLQCYLQLKLYYEKTGSSSSAIRTTGLLSNRL